MGNPCMDQSTFATLIVLTSVASMLFGVGLGHIMAADFLRARRLAKAQSE